MMVEACAQIEQNETGSSSESIEQLQLALETSEIAVAKMTAKLRLPEEDPKTNPSATPSPIISRVWKSS